MSPRTAIYGFGCDCFTAVQSAKRPCTLLRAGLSTRQHLGEAPNVNTYIRQSSSAPATSDSPVPLETDRLARSPLGHIAKQKQADREFFTDLLSSAATKRDAKAYLSRLRTPPKTKPIPTRVRIARPKVNLGGLFGRARAVEESPVFTQYEGIKDKFEELEILNVALVKLTNVTELTDATLSGIAQTLSQLARLSMAPCVVLDNSTTTFDARQEYVRQAERLTAAIDSIGETSGRLLDNLFSSSHDGVPHVSFQRPLVGLLRGGRIPIIAPVVLNQHQSLEVISSNDAILALARHFGEQNTPGLPTASLHEAQSEPDPNLHSQVSLDRIILVDPVGAVPSKYSPYGKHVFINLEQEYEAIKQVLPSLEKSNISQHISNLTLLRDVLKLLPSTSSGLITTPTDASNVGQAEQESRVTVVGTRRQKNALIHNLLTDKPAYSSSLPESRLTRQDGPTPAVAVSTFVKQGMPLTILPNPFENRWTPDNPRIKLTDAALDLNRLVFLIDDSFNRKLDLDHYLARVNEKMAGVIIAGEYEGGAILTWEVPPGADPEDKSRWVPYLDKFAVLKKSQGAGGHADILFNAMVRTCFPRGVCWRSRKNNPVNKWYFERSRGTWKIPDMNWTMFWTTPGVAASGQTFSDYEGVCRGVEPSWADKKKAAD